MDNFFKWVVGYAAADIEPGSTTLYVFVPEISPMVNDQYVDDTVSALDIKDIPTNGGDIVGGVLQISNAIPAEYTGRSNMSIPNIVQGETVYVAEKQNGQFYWKETGLNHDYRKMEKVSIHAANKATILEKLTDLNTYRATLDTVTKTITITTSLPGIVHTIKINQLQGTVTIADSLGNSILLDSIKSVIKLTNKLQTSVEVNKLNVNIDAPGSINLTAGTLVKIDTPALHVNSNITVLDGVDVAINAAQSALITTPIAGVNGQLSVTTGVVSNLISGGVVSLGGSAAPMTPCKIDDASETGTGSGQSPPVAPVLPPDTAVSYTNMQTMMTSVVNAITALGNAILANEAAHTGITTAPSPATPTLVATSVTQAAVVTSTMPVAALPLIKGASGPPS